MRHVSYYTLHFNYPMTHWEEQDVGGSTILKWILDRWDGMDWIDLAQDMEQ
jgi:hypothetical protein